MSQRNQTVSALPWCPPSEFDGYRLGGVLGHGGMGTVYLAHDCVLDRPVAVKFIRGAHLDAREMFLNEARAAARLQHPNVVSIYRVGEIDGQPYIVSEYIRGQGLDRLPRPMSSRRVIEIGVALCRGLAAAHRRGILHRDLKLSNAIQGTDGEIKLLDFGLAKLSGHSDEVEVAVSAAEGEGESEPSEPSHTMDLGSAESVSRYQHPLPSVVLAPPSTLAGAADSAQPTERAGQALGSAGATDPAGLRPISTARLSPEAAGQAPAGEPGSPQPVASDRGANSSTRASSLKGTPVYMAPEVLRGEPSSIRSDIYSMGALLFALCSKGPPFQGLPFLDLVKVVNEVDAPLLQSIVPDVNPELAEIVNKCLARNPEQRYRNTDELREDLERLHEGPLRRSLPEGNPYRGLLPFEAEHRALFFGRQAEIGTIIERLRTEPSVLVVADSGIGKSSVIRAGVLPALRDGVIDPSRTWRSAIIVPGASPRRSLISALAELLELPSAALSKSFAEDPRQLGRELATKLGDKRGATLFVDQLEELVTLCSLTEASWTSEALASLQGSVSGFRLLMTARADYLSRLGALPGLGDEINRAFYLLRPLSGPRLRDVIVGPAHCKGVKFEAEALIEHLASSTERTEGGLPLLQFALCELWEARLNGQGPITQAALEAIGGVEGALARHADLVLGRLAPDERSMALEIIMRLVTQEGTRTRRSLEELSPLGPQVDAILRALVRGRLLVARQAADATYFEVAHEALIRGWGTLQTWLERNKEARAVRHRLESATSEWVRLGKNRELLWGPQQLAETSLLKASDIGDKERLFLRASQSRLLRKRRIRRALILAVPTSAALIYGGVRLAAAKDIERRVTAQQSQGHTLYKIAKEQSQQLQERRQQAFTLFDSRQREKGEELWAQALTLTQQIDRLYSKSAQALETAHSLDSSRRDIHRMLAAVLFERAMIAERDGDVNRRADIADRLAIYDDGTQAAKLQSSATIHINTSPIASEIKLQRYIEGNDHKLHLAEERSLGRPPVSRLSVPPGSYLVTTTLDGYYNAKYPIYLEPGEESSANITMMAQARVPRGFAYIPSGNFLFGVHGSEDQRKNFFNTVPMHRVSLPGYLIGIHETTYGEYIEYLESLPTDKRAAALPGVGAGGSSGMLALSQLPDGKWRLSFRPSSVTFTADAGQPLVYPGRSRRRSVNWLRLPVGGISYKMLVEYSQWLASAGRVPGARPCTELEWQRAARGADARIFPSGMHVDSDDANIDETYERKPESSGPDEVGAHPNSQSPFGVMDLMGNLSEIVTPSLVAEGAVALGSSFVYGRLTARIENRNVLDPGYREADTGARVCASLPERND